MQEEAEREQAEIAAGKKRNMERLSKKDTSFEVVMRPFASKTYFSPWSDAVPVTKALLLRVTTDGLRRDVARAREKAAPIIQKFDALDAACKRWTPQGYEDLSSKIREQNLLLVQSGNPGAVTPVPDQKLWMEQAARERDVCSVEMKALAEQANALLLDLADKLQPEFQKAAQKTLAAEKADFEGLGPVTGEGFRASAYLQLLVYFGTHLRAHVEIYEKASSGRGPKASLCGILDQNVAWE